MGSRSKETIFKQKEGLPGILTDPPPFLHHLPPSLLPFSSSNRPSRGLSRQSLEELKYNSQPTGMSGSSCEDGGGRERLLGSEESSSDVWATRPVS